MRPHGTFICVCLLFCAIAGAQAQVVRSQPDSRPMQERFTAEPNYNLTYSDPSVKPVKGNNFYSGAKNTEIKSFSFIKGFKTSTFKTNQYNTADFWQGNFKFKTSDANLTSHSTLSSILKIFKTKTAETKTAVEGSETFKTRDYAQLKDTSKNIFRGKIQDRLNKEGVKVLQGQSPIQGGGDMHVMTIDEVRDLLNKSK